MAISFQYNKTSLQDVKKQLKIREKALPILKSKESALRIEVKKARYKAEELERELHEHMDQYESMDKLWEEFDPELISIDSVELDSYKIAGVMIPDLKEIHFKIKEFSFFNKPSWFPDGIAVLKELARIGIEKEIYIRKMELLEQARKKTTQKVNLYEKVQIPEYENAIIKIKRFLEDKENLEKSSQKIVKKRQEENSNGL